MKFLRILLRYGTLCLRDAFGSLGGETAHPLAIWILTNGLNAATAVCQISGTVAVRPPGLLVFYCRFLIFSAISIPPVSPGPGVNHIAKVRPATSRSEAGFSGVLDRTAVAIK
jgi:hypothetical protein